MEILTKRGIPIIVHLIIGLPGETVYIRDGKIYINDSKQPLKEDYLKEEWVEGNDYEEPFEYDGTEKHITLKGVPWQIAVRYRDNRAIAPGKYTAKAYLTYDNENYDTPDIDTTIDWEITGKE